jgi:hypothetical protein
MNKVENISKQEKAIKILTDVEIGLYTYGTLTPDLQSSGNRSCTNGERSLYGNNQKISELNTSPHWTMKQTKQMICRHILYILILHIKEIKFKLNLEAHKYRFMSVQRQ